MLGRGTSSELLLGARLRVTADGLPLGSSSFADDDASSPQKREATRLLALAEQHLAAEEFSESADKAKQAMQLLLDAGLKQSACEAMKLMIDSWRQEALLEGQTRPQKAMDYIAEQVEKAQSKSDKLTEAALLLSKAELYTADIKGSGALETAYQAAMTARDLFSELQAKSMEGYAQLALANVHFLRGRGKDVSAAATAAQALFKGTSNKVGEARSMHAMALSYLDAEDYESAQKKAREALQIYRGLANKELEAFELLACALLNLEGDKASKAQPLAEEALKIMSATRGSGKGGLSKDAFALHIIVESLCRRKQDKKALKAAKEAEEHFQKLGQQQGLVYGGEVVLHAYTKLEKPEEGIAAGDKAQSLAQKLGAKKMEINLLHYLMQAHVQAGDMLLAVQAMEDATNIAQALGDSAEEAYARHEVAKLHLTPSAPGGRVEDKKIDRAVASANEARALFRGLDLKDEEASALMTAATGHFMQGDADRARSEAMEAQDIFEEEGYHKGADYAMSLIIDCFSADEEYPQAIEVAEKRRDMWHDLGNKKMEAGAACSLANAFYSTEEYEEAARVASSAKALYEKCGDMRGKVISSMILTQAYVALLMKEEGDPVKPSRAFTEAKNKCLSAAAEAVAYSGKAGDKALRGAAIMWRARALMWSFRHEDAKRAAEEAKRIFLDLGDVAGQGQALLLIANVLNLTNAKDKAIEAGNECLEVAQSVEDFVTADAAKELIDALTARPAAPVQMAEAAALPGAAPTAAAASGPAAIEKKGLDPELTRKKVFEIVKNVMASDEELEADMPLMEAGMDSLSSVQMVSELAKEFSMQMAPSLVFDFPTVNALAEDIVAQSMG
mmetsp:Transcript_23404/g.54452  ORF Transcript_23404/g.54452 Transcript_23404/m.54452 type:complete len:848 (-) Transcript_23404:85-2628(-)